MNYNSVCRCCLQESFQLFYIFGHEVEIKLKTCTDILLKHGDGLPDLICSTCLQELNVSYDFRNKCNESDKTLRNFIATTDFEKDNDHICPEFIVIEGTNNEPKALSEVNVKREEKITETADGVIEFMSENENNDDNDKDEKFIKLFNDAKTEEDDALQVNTNDADDHIEENISFTNEDFSDEDKLQMEIDFIKKEDDISIKDGENSKPISESDENEKGKHECKICDKKFKFSYLLTVHQCKQHDKNRTYECDECEKVFLSIDLLKIHKKSHQFDECPHCNKKYVKTYHAEYIKHIESHMNAAVGGENVQTINNETCAKLHECEICHKKFKRVYNLTIHHTIHTKEKSYKCEECDKIFYHHRSLRDHSNSHKFQKCPYCNKRYSKTSREPFKDHIKTHTNEEIRKCEQCDKIFKFESTYKRHLRLHDENQQHQCTICSKVFPTKYSLKKHVWRHTKTDITNYTRFCEYCGKIFQNIAEFNRHLRFHTGDRPYECQYCNEKFFTSSNLTCHMRRHTNERPYSCSICDKKFASLHSKRNHMYMHDPETKFPCTICGKKYATPRRKKEHERKHLPNQQLPGLSLAK